MDRIKQIVLFLCLIIVLPLKNIFAQQDPQFTQYMFNPVAINPGYTGSREILSTTLLYRHQWVGFGEGSPITQTLSIHAPFKRQKIAAGLLIINDAYGPVRNTGYMGSYAYRFTMPVGKLSIGIRAGVFDLKYNSGLIEYKDKADYFASMPNVRKVVSNFDFGTYYYTKTFFAGIAFSHLGNIRLIQDEATGQKRLNLLKNFTATIGKAVAINDYWVFKPSAIFRTSGFIHRYADINLSFLYDNRIWLGAAVRTNSTFMFLTELNVTNKFRVGYSYDLTVGPLRSTNGGSHEIFMGYDFTWRSSTLLSPRYF